MHIVCRRQRRCCQPCVSRRCRRSVLIQRQGGVLVYRGERAFRTKISVDLAGPTARGMVMVSAAGCRRRSHCVKRWRKEVEREKEVTMKERDRKSSSRSIDRWVALLVVAGPLHTSVDTNSSKFRPRRTRRDAEKKDIQVQISEDRLIQQSHSKKKIVVEGRKERVWPQWSLIWTGRARRRQWRRNQSI